MYKPFASLATLINSKAKREIIKELLFNPNKTFTVRELARRAKLNVNAVAYAARQLEKNHIILKEIKGKRHLLRLNRSHPFYLDILSMFHKSYGLGYLLYREIAKEDLIEIAILTHHYLLQIPKAEYDVDVIFIGEINVMKLNQKIEELENKTGTQIVFTLLTPTDIKLRLRRFDEFIYKILLNPHVFIKGNWLTLMKHTL